MSRIMIASVPELKCDLFGLDCQFKAGPRGFGLATDRNSPPLAPSEVVATGTLTRALPIKSGERWSTYLDGLPLAGISVAIA